MQNVAVFCGSGPGNDSIWVEEATRLGKVLAKRRMGLVYGGAQIGLMGAVADAVMGEGGHVTGVLPHFMARKEIAHEGISELILVENMHERKLTMSNKADGFIALPGGFGTMEELFEVLTWAQLGLHQNPVAVLNCNNYYDKLMALLHHMNNAGFVSKVNLDMVITANDPETLLDLMESYVAPPQPIWLKKPEDT